MDESYASLDQKSINGIDSFYDILKGTKRKIQVSSYFTKEAQKAGVIIHFEREWNYEEEVYRNLEAWMSGLELNPDENTDKDKIVYRGRHLAVPDEPPAAEEEDQSDSNTDEENTGEDNTEETKPSAQRLKPVTLIYFLRDTTASKEFWQKLTSNLKAFPAERQFAEEQLAERAEQARVGEAELPTLFGYRAARKGFTEAVSAKDFSSDEIDHLPAWYPYRILHAGEPALSVEETFAYRTLLLGNEQDLIRTFYMNRGKVILVYNAEPFLNYAQAQTAQRKFAEDFIAYALKDVPAEESIAIIRNAPIPPRTQKEKEENPFRMFAVFPLNVIFFQLLVFLTVFLLSRAKAGVPLRQEPAHGTRDFTEHFTALGNLIRKTGTRS